MDSVEFRATWDLLSQKNKNLSWFAAGIYLVNPKTTTSYLIKKGKSLKLMDALVR